MSWVRVKGRRALGHTAHSPLHPDPGAVLAPTALDALNSPWVKAGPVRVDRPALGNRGIVCFGPLGVQAWSHSEPTT